MALVLITHDLALVAEAAHKIIVMSGQVVETGDAHAIFHAPRHPYTQALLRALPELLRTKNVWRGWRSYRQVPDRRQAAARRTLPRH